jgi:hypothetical protein
MCDRRTAFRKTGDPGVTRSDLEVFDALGVAFKELRHERVLCPQVALPEGGCKVGPESVLKWPLLDRSHLH